MTKPMHEHSPTTLTDASPPRFHGGIAQGFAAVGAAAAVTAVIAASSWSDAIAPRLVMSSFVLFCAALAIGSSRIVGLSSLGVLGSALIWSALTDSPTWVESMVIGCLWYVAVELAWDSIERRDGAVRSVAYNLRRVQELSAVVAVCLAVAWLAFAATALGPTRTLLGKAVFLLAALAAIASAIGHITATAPKSGSEP